MSEPIWWMRNSFQNSSNSCPTQQNGWKMAGEQNSLKSRNYFPYVLLWKFSFTYQTISQKNSITEVKNRLQASGGWGDFFLKSTLLAHYQLWTVLSWTLNLTLTEAKCSQNSIDGHPHHKSSNPPENEIPPIWSLIGVFLFYSVAL